MILMVLQLMMTKIVPEPPPIPSMSSTAAGASRRSSAAIIGGTAVDASVRALEEIAETIATECLRTRRSIRGIDDLDPILAVIGEGAVIYIDSVGASARDLHTIALVLVGGYIGQRDIALGGDIETVGAVSEELTVRNLHGRLTVENGAFLSVALSLDTCQGDAHYRIKRIGKSIRQLRDNLQAVASIGGSFAGGGDGIFVVREDAVGNGHLAVGVDSRSE